MSRGPRYIYDRATDSFVLRPSYRGSTTSGMIMPDIPDFVSPIDGKVVNGRAGLREHNKRHNVTNVADFTQTWKKQGEERAKAYTPGSGYDSKRRKEHIIRAFEKIRRGP